MLGVRPHVGRLLTKNDDVTRGEHPVVVLSYRYWQRRFGGDPSVVGRALSVSGYPMTIVGVSPPGFDGLDPGQAIDLRVPLAMQAEVRRAPATLDRAAARELHIVARLRSGVDVGRAREILSARLRRYLAEREPASETSAVRSSERVELLPAATGFGMTRLQFQTSLRVLLVITGSLLLIACANVANLFLARAAARTHEFAVRASLGASSARLGRLLLTESLVIAAAGAVAGALVAYPAAIGLMKLLAAGRQGLQVDVSPGAAVLAFHFAVSMMSLVVVGALPALVVGRQPIAGMLKRGGSSRPRQIFLTTQVALSVLVLVGAALFLRTALALRSTDLGFRPDNLIVTALSPQNAGRSQEEAMAFFRSARERVLAVQGVEAAAYSVVRALANSPWRTDVVFDRPVPAGFATGPFRNVVGPDYFRTLGIPIVAGREFTPADESVGAPRRDRQRGIRPDVYTRARADRQAAGRRAARVRDCRRRQRCQVPPTFGNRRRRCGTCPTSSSRT